MSPRVCGVYIIVAKWLEVAGSGILWNTMAYYGILRGLPSQLFSVFSVAGGNFLSFSKFLPGIHGRTASPRFSKNFRDMLFAWH